MVEADDETSGVTSICCDPTKAPINYHWFRLTEEPTLLDAFRSILDQESLIQFDRDRFVGEFRARLKKLSEGRLRPIDNLKGPMRDEKRLNLYEVRWRWEYGEDRELRVRAYHAEPRVLRGKLSNTVVGLHLHKKNVDEDTDVDAEQTEEIKRAAERFYVGRGAFWGIPTPEESI